MLFNNSLREVQGFMYNFGLPKSALVVGCCASILIAGGCASKTDFYVLQDDVQELQKRSLDSGGASAEVYAEVERLQERIAELQGTIEQMQYRMEQEQSLPLSDQVQQAGTAALVPEAVVAQPGIEQQAVVDTVAVQDAGEQPVDEPLPAETVATGPVEDGVMDEVQADSVTTAVTEPVPVEPVVPDDTQLFTEAIKHFDAYEYEEARAGFASLLAEYPRSSYADDAQFRIAESYYNEKWYEKAILEYQLVIEKYPEGDARASAFFKQALAFENIGDAENARQRYVQLQELYPDSDEAAAVVNRLQ